MVALGTAMALVSAWVAVVVLRKRRVDRPATVAAARCAIVAPFGFVATEAGWTVTEVGRQPWVVQGVLRTADAVHADARPRRSDAGVHSFSTFCSARLSSR